MRIDDAMGQADDLIQKRKDRITIADGLAISKLISEIHRLRQTIVSNDELIAELDQVIKDKVQ